LETFAEVQFEFFLSAPIVCFVQFWHFAAVLAFPLLLLPPNDFSRKQHGKVKRARPEEKPK